MLLNHEEIEKLCLAPLYYGQHPMITPYDPGDKKPGVFSYGNGSYGYDIRLGRKFKIFHDTVCEEVDPKNVDPSAFLDFEGPVCRIPPNSYVLAETVETFCIPDDVLGVVVGKSTYARVAAIANITPLEPGWRGRLTLEIANLCRLPIKLYADEGIAQVLFFRGNPTQFTYGKRSALYQDQAGLTLARVRGQDAS